MRPVQAEFYLHELPDFCEAFERLTEGCLPVGLGVGCMVCGNVLLYCWERGAGALLQCQDSLLDEALVLRALCCHPCSAAAPVLWLLLLSLRQKCQFKRASPDEGFPHITLITPQACEASSAGPTKSVLEQNRTITCQVHCKLAIRYGQSLQHFEALIANKEKVLKRQNPQMNDLRTIFGYCLSSPPGSVSCPLPCCCNYVLAPLLWLFPGLLACTGMPSRIVLDLPGRIVKHATIE